MDAVKSQADSNVLVPGAAANQKAGATAQSGVAPADQSQSLARKLLANRALVSMLLFLAVSFFWAAAELGKLSPADFAFRTWTACAIDEFLSNAEPRPKLDFIGSSLMLVPLGGVDADYLNRAIDAPHHHHSVYVESTLKKLTGADISTFNFALPGEMPSDAYLITKFLLKGEKKPDVLVYGVGPRDFLDNLLPSPGATDPYQYLSRFGDVQSRIDQIAPDWQQRLNYELGRVFYPYGKKNDLALDFTRSVTAVIDRLLPGAKPISIAARRSLLPDYKPFEVGKNDCLFRPSTADSRRFTDNIGEYRKRYKELKWDTYLSQMRFMADLLNTAREQGVQVVIVAMPITEINRNLMSDLAWETYRKGVKVLALSKGATYIDMQGSNQFKLEDFGDTVHLHSGGGRKLLDLICAKLADNISVRSALGIGRGKERSLALSKGSQI